MKALVGVWGNNAVSWSSPLTAYAAMDGITREVTSELAPIVASSGQSIAGRVTGAQVTLWIRRPGRLNAVKSTVRGDVIPNGDGCILAGSYGMHPIVKAIAAVSLVVAGWTLPFVLASLVGHQGGWSAAMYLVVAPLCAVAVAAGLSAVLLRARRTDAAVIASWLTFVLATPQARTRVHVG